MLLQKLKGRLQVTAITHKTQRSLSLNCLQRPGRTKGRMACYLNGTLFYLLCNGCYWLLLQRRRFRWPRGVLKRHTRPRDIVSAQKGKERVQRLPYPCAIQHKKTTCQLGRELYDVLPHLRGSLEFQNYLLGSGAWFAMRLSTPLLVPSIVGGLVFPWKILYIQNTEVGKLCADHTTKSCRIEMGGFHI